MYLKCLIICSYLILNCCAMQLIHSAGPPSKFYYILNNQNSIPNTPAFINTVDLRRPQPNYDSIKVFFEPINSFSGNVNFNAPQILIRRQRSTQHNNAVSYHFQKRKTSILKHGRNLAALSGAVHKLVKKFNKKDKSTTVTETSKNPILLSPEDSKDNVPITDLINSYSPNDNHNDVNDQGNSKNSKHLIKSVQKSMLSNKVSSIHNHHNIQTKINYMRNPYFIVAIVALAVIILAAVIAGIVVHARMQSCH